MLKITKFLNTYYVNFTVSEESCESHVTYTLPVQMRLRQLCIAMKVERLLTNCITSDYNNIIIELKSKFRDEDKMIKGN